MHRTDVPCEERNLVVDLGRVNADSLSLVGGKAANLGVLIQAGFRVPLGFCLTTDAYRLAVDHTALGPVPHALRGTGVDDVPRLAQLAEQARAIVLDTDVPASVAEAVRQAYTHWGEDEPVAVRSSATAEDLPTASFAGQQDTFLNVVGGDAVVDAIRRCWASLFTDRAVVYRAQNGIIDVAIAAAGRRIERHFAAPQDVEWAVDAAGILWVTQSRPITTLYPRASRTPSLPGSRAYLCLSLAQELTRPITPMGLAGLRVIASSMAQMGGVTVRDTRSGPVSYTEIGQRVFLDVTPMLRSRIGHEVLGRALGVMEARSAVVLGTVGADARYAVTSRSPLPVARRFFRVVARIGAVPVLVRSVIWPKAALRHAEQVGNVLEQLSAVSPGATSRERLDHAERILGSIFPLVPTVLPVAAAGFLMLAAARTLLGASAAPGEMQSVLRGLPHNVTTEMDLALWPVAQAIRLDEPSLARFEASPVHELAEEYRQGTLPRAAHDALRGFLGRYGHRAVAEIDLGMPRWSEDPTHMVGLVANYLRLSDPERAPDRQFEAAAGEAEATVARLVAKARRRGWLCGVLVHAALGRARLLCGLRELPKNYIVLVLGAARRQLALVGRELVDRGLFVSEADVFWLDLGEAQRALSDGEDYQPQILERRAAYERELRRRHVPRVLLSDGTEPEALPGAALHSDPGTLLGSPASAGTITGTARVILDPVGAHLEPGEILVAPSTDPGWTPLFLTAGALVMEMGGSNSHGAVVAREYGIPAVVGVTDATLRIATGQRVTVDGAAGTVILD
ncbi:PEP/pyruvate-binding domain-containing protein [Cryobacterium psychrophilum]|uniref:Phosphoenolpyruvate synthase n=1 Tax=Cryobacterium psychrophilum TaxID=41988 RepID=A0A4Y8KN58_9MICO|nr:PEP/pyruvate-binding domain-containing protein [Cryobacterium psychrophilum]TDW31055.1 pyruvate phosphate dikinase-like enzyme [Cryobacterium psychrophilum]TFD78645.1 phosphoenolpyruvate synthase [Cryobacterium psychrophilum]